MTSVTADTTLQQRLWRRFLAWAERVRLANKLALLLTAAALAAGIATYAALTESAPIGGAKPETVTLLLTLDVILLLLLGALIARKIVHIWMHRRRGMAGSRLHVRLVVVFSLLAVTPAILVATFSTFFFHFGIQSWFSDRVRTAVNESQAVARAYLHEHQQNIRAEVLAMANDLNQEAPLLLGNPERFNRIVSTQAALRGLAEAVVFDGATRQIFARSAFSFALTFEPVPDDALDRARGGDVALLVSDTDDRVRALVRLDRFVDSYLYVGRFIEPRVLAHMENAQSAVRQYAELEGRRSSLQITVTVIFGLVCLLLLLAAVWIGLNFATFLARPISALIAAAERVRAGDLTTRVTEPADEDELGTLSRAFNRMTSEIESQRHELIGANQQLDLRRRFTEAVLAGVSAGVLGLDQDGVINLPNQSAADLLGVDEARSLMGVSLVEAVPEMAELMDAIRRRPGRLVEAQIQVRQTGTSPRTLLVRIAAEVVDAEIRGFVVTFDDITELLSAQRKAAWADVARRIAHEIKNPLTPIQLSAERLRRKYLKEITSDKDTFQICVDTIIRHVVDIGRMVDEFSAFARMPTPVMKPAVIHDVCRQAAFLQSNAHPNIRFECLLPSERLHIPCDARQIAQALTNLLQNAVDAIDGREAPGAGAALPPGHVAIRVTTDGERLTIAVEDNGKGLPTTVERHRLTEPYVTTRAKGTGLGLAIVRKIMEDHGGELTLEDRAEGGVRVCLHIPLSWSHAAASPSNQSVAQTAPQEKHTSHGA